MAMTVAEFFQYLARGEDSRQLALELAFAYETRAARIRREAATWR
jgi:hypothetical protein